MRLMISDTSIFSVAKVSHNYVYFCVLNLIKIELTLDIIVPVLKHIFGSCDLILDHLAFPRYDFLLIISSLL